MLARILSMVREKLTKSSSHDVETPHETIIQDPVAEFVVQIDAEGDFAIGAECFSTEEKYAPLVGMTLYLLNSGMLSDYFAEALRLCSEGDEEKTSFTVACMGCWREIYDQEGGAITEDSRDAVNPRDVFSFYKMRP
jgi:hypothetical protein